MPRRSRYRCASFVLVALSSTVAAQTTSSVQYLGNEGVMVTHEDTKVLFDPLFGQSFDIYQLVPPRIVDAIYAGDPPYDGVDAVFVSHYHGDHFSAEAMLRLLAQRTDVHLYAPAQAVAEMRAGAEDHELFDRVTTFDLEYGDEPVFVRTEDLLIEAIRVPHSGWPTRRTEVQNIAFRVTLADTSTVLHLGDADARVVHFEQNAEYWFERRIDLALPPYWFFMSRGGQEVLEDHIDIRNTIGIHVPASYGDDPASVPDELLGYELFTFPGEGRRFTGSQ